MFRILTQMLHNSDVALMNNNIILKMGVGTSNSRKVNKINLMYIYQGELSNHFFLPNTKDRKFGSHQ